jgi:hypothetical protein
MGRIKVCAWHLFHRRCQNSSCFTFDPFWFLCLLWRHNRWTDSVSQKRRKVESIGTDIYTDFLLKGKTRWISVLGGYYFSEISNLVCLFTVPFFFIVDSNSYEIRCLSCYRSSLYQRLRMLTRTIVVRITGFLDFVHRTVFWKLENITFRKLDFFPSSGEEADTHSVGPLERANLNHGTTHVSIK